MKKNITILIAFLLSIFKVYAQEDPTHVTVHAGETPIEQLLTDEQKAAVTHLSVTGTLQDEDYAFIRTNLLKQLQELNLREADIDTIPEGALEYVDNNDGKVYGEFKIILPLKLSHLSRRCFYIKQKECKFEVTGHFPSLESETFYYNNDVFSDIDYSYKNFFLSKDNEYCTRSIVAIYSADMDTLYRAWNAKGSVGVFVLDDCKLIAGHAFEGCQFNYENGIIIPESVDSIGDCAFFPIYHWGDAYFFHCYSKVPPLLGKNVFNKEICEFYVPDAALETYKASEQWKDFKIYPSSKFQPVMNIGNIIDDKNIKISFADNNLIIASEEEIRYISIYDLQGKRIFSNQIMSKDFRVPSNIIKESLFLIKIDFTDGTSPTYKVKK